MLDFVAVSSGSGKADFEKLQQVLTSVPDIRYICLDVANGYSEHFVEFVRSVREAFPQHVIMVPIIHVHFLLYANHKSIVSELRREMW